MFKQVDNILLSKKCLSKLEIFNVGTQKNRLNETVI